jgi:hypothetical protein
VFSLAFAVAVDKRTKSPAECGRAFDLAWEGALQRLERTCTKEKMSLMIVHDAGEDAAVRRWTRQARRHLTAGDAFGPGSVGNNPLRLLVDDPVPRDSRQNYFVQMADLVAYAAFRSVVPPGPAIAGVCPQSMWGNIGPATHTAVTSVKRRAAAGIVLR